MITVRAAVDRDKPQILALISNAFGATAAKAEELWHWRWELHPHLSPKGYRGVVAERNGTLIGTMTCLPAGLVVAGKPVDASWLINMMVDSGLYRQALRAERTARREDRRADPDRSQQKRQGLAAQMFAFQVARGPLLTRHRSDRVFVVMEKERFRDLADTRYLNRSLSFTQRIARIVGRFIAPPLGVIPNLVVARLPRPTGTVARLDGDFDESFDQLWDEASRTYEAITRRDSKTLQWRYRQRPDAEYVALVARDGERLRGYAIVRTFERRRCVRGRIVDLLTCADDGTTRRDLLCASLSTLRELGADRVACYASDESVASELADLGFTSERSATPTAVLGFDHCAGFYSTMGDGDAD